MKLYEKILNHFSNGSDNYYIEKYNVAIWYNGYVKKDDEYYHNFTLKSCWVNDSKKGYLDLQEEDDGNLSVKGSTCDVISVDNSEFHDALFTAFINLSIEFTDDFGKYINGDVEQKEDDIIACESGSSVAEETLPLKVSDVSPYAKHVYYIIYLEHGDKPNQFITSVKDEWMAKDLCKNYGFKYRNVLVEDI